MERIKDANVRSLENGDIIVKGAQEEIAESSYKDTWTVLANWEQEIEVGKSVSAGSTYTMKKKIPHSKLLAEEWYKLQENELTHN